MFLRITYRYLHCALCVILRWRMKIVNWIALCRCSRSYIEGGMVYNIIFPAQIPSYVLSTQTPRRHIHTIVYMANNQKHPTLFYAQSKPKTKRCLTAEFIITTIGFSTTGEWSTRWLAFSSKKLWFLTIYSLLHITVQNIIHEYRRCEQHNNAPKTVVSVCKTPQNTLSTARDPIMRFCDYSSIFL